MTTQIPALMPERKHQRSVKSTQLQYVLYMVLAFEMNLSNVE